MNFNFNLIINLQVNLSMTTFEPTPMLQFDGEGEDNLDIEMQFEQSRHVSGKRSWLVDVIDKLLTQYFLCLS